MVGYPGAADDVAPVAGVHQGQVVLLDHLDELAGKLDA